VVAFPAGASASEIPSGTVRPNALSKYVCGARISCIPNPHRISWSAERRRSTAGGRLEGARKRALPLHLKEAKRDDFLEHRARQLQRLVIQPYSDALAQRVRNPDSTMRGRAVFFKGAHYEFSHPGAWSPNG
jgi:hypothetical protein